MGERGAHLRLDPHQLGEDADGEGEDEHQHLPWAF